MKDIYCLPGTMCDEGLWQFTQPLLGDVNLKHVVLPEVDTLDGIVEALSLLLPNEPIHLLGFSMGGYLASAFALKYPERIQQLMVVSNAAQGLLEREVVQRKQALNWVLRHGYKGIPKKKAIAMLGNHNKNSDFIIQVIQAMDARLGERVFVQQLSSSLNRPSLLSQLEKSSIDLCFCVGEEDVLVPLETFKLLESNARFLCSTVKHCGHMIPLEQPVWLAQKLIAFFRFG
ncbi:alpha/beta fold hydrolase [Marinomonas flavescens]|uniref:alpha/beta fold hydrolase n=1 Tax=Marinomonas flavescens TaxID=2529379 RepID=UPI001F0A2430|nr:alpha/beta hydrolase [Marinomonas flavescens]